MDFHGSKCIRYNRYVEFEDIHAHDVLSFAKPSLAAWEIKSKRLRRLLLSKPGGNPMPAIAQSEIIAPKRILDTAWQSRCAILAEPRPALGPPAGSENLYTAKEVTWYTYRETGMYTIIRGNVYDMTSTSHRRLSP